ncbi:MAG: hypothetical protein N0E48_22830 [Candidatus Thiodiazotropha endolucinida]|nr:hypothetical protein [Candidatus Thiodiazotropha taylori]MCW4346169.1 hypothetical protein [Candidatus Thiodiazotropha endolucinida]
MEQPETVISRNHSSIYRFTHIVDEKINHESGLGRIAGPYDSQPFEHFVCSPLAVIPKSVPGKFRLIHDLSFPSHNSVNLGIPSEMSRVQYDNIDVVIDLVRTFGPGALMAKTDIEDAFRVIPIHPADYHLLGFWWRDKFYYDRVLPMGASSSCKIFNTFSSALKWIMLNNFQASGMSHILDDFFFIGPKDSDKCGQDLSRFLSLAADIGVPIKHEKTEQPCTKIVIYGIEIDSVAMESRLPAEKLSKIRDKLNDIARRKKVTLKTLQSLIGLLNFACCVICPGRAFLRRLIDLTCGIRSQNFYIRLNKEARADIKAWLTFIDSFNGKSVFLPTQWQSSDSLSFYTDASGAKGFAAIFGNEWFAYSWSDKMQHYQIAIKELFPIVIALEHWGSGFRDSKVLFLTDNMAVVEIINKQTSKEKVLMTLIRRLVLSALRFNILFCAKHIPGKHNVIADRLSRLQFQEAFSVAPQLEQSRVQVAACLLQI